MTASQVYFTDVRAPVDQPERWYQPKLSAVNKLGRLVLKSGILDNISKGDQVAIKTHFGVHGTTKPLRPVFIRKVVQMVKDKGGKPFVTETTGLGMTKERSFAVSKIETAEENGYTSQTLSAPIIIADGLQGFDGVEVQVEGLQLKKVYVARHIAEADKVISLAHFKGHIDSGFGGALKSIGVGCIAKPSKYDVHIREPPTVNPERCTKCGACIDICPVDAIKDWKIDPTKCVRCQGCAEVCKDAISLNWVSSQELCERLTDCAKAVIDCVGRENFRYVNFLLDITPHCDCCPYSDNPIVPDLGILASDDILAIDKASVDMVNQAPTLPNSMAKCDEDKFHAIFEWTHSKYQLEAAEKLGLGSMKYEVIKVE